MGAIACACALISNPPEAVMAARLHEGHVRVSLHDCLCIGTMCCQKLPDDLRRDIAGHQEVASHTVPCTGKKQAWNHICTQCCLAAWLSTAATAGQKTAASVPGQAAAWRTAMHTSTDSAHTCFAASCSTVHAGHSRPRSWQLATLTAALVPVCLYFDCGFGTDAFAPAGSWGKPCILPPGKASSNLSTSKQQDPGPCEGSAGSGSLTSCIWREAGTKARAA